MFNVPLKVQEVASEALWRHINTAETSTKLILSCCPLIYASCADLTWNLPTCSFTVLLCRSCGIRSWWKLIKWVFLQHFDELVYQWSLAPFPKKRRQLWKMWLHGIVWSIWLKWNNRNFTDRVTSPHSRWDIVVSRMYWWSSSVKITLVLPSICYLVVLYSLCLMKTNWCYPFLFYNSFFYGGRALVQL